MSTMRLKPVTSIAFIGMALLAASNRVYAHPMSVAAITFVSTHKNIVDKHAMSPQLRAKIKAIINDPDMTPLQKRLAINALCPPHGVPDKVILLSLSVLPMLGYGTKMGLAIRNRREELRRERIKYEQRCAKQLNAMNELYAPKPEDPPDPFVVLKNNAKAIPVTERTTSFFTSRPIAMADSVDMTLVIGGVTVVVDVTLDERSFIVTGKIPLVRTFTVDGILKPWYEWGGYDPYEHYWDSVAGGWTWPNSKTIMGWIELDNVDPRLPGYADRTEATPLDWIDATKKRSGVLFRWSQEKRRLAKALNPALAASYRPPRPMPPSYKFQRSRLKHDKLAPLAQSALPSALRKSRPAGGAYSFRIPGLPAEQPRVVRRAKRFRLRKSLLSIAPDRTIGLTSATQTVATASENPALALVAKPPLHKSRREVKAGAPAQDQAINGPTEDRSHLQVGNTAAIARSRKDRIREAGSPRKTQALDAASQFWSEAGRMANVTSLSGDANNSSMLPPFPKIWAEQIRDLHKQLQESINKSNAVETDPVDTELMGEVQTSNLFNALDEANDFEQDFSHASNEDSQTSQPQEIDYAGSAVMPRPLIASSGYSSIHSDYLDDPRPDDMLSSSKIEPVDYTDHAAITDEPVLGFVAAGPEGIGAHESASREPSGELSSAQTEAPIAAGKKRAFKLRSTARQIENELPETQSIDAVESAISASAPYESTNAFKSAAFEPTGGAEAEPPVELGMYDRPKSIISKRSGRKTLRTMVAIVPQQSQSNPASGAPLTNLVHQDREIGTTSRLLDEQALQMPHREYMRVPDDLPMVAASRTAARYPGVCASTSLVRTPLGSARTSPNRRLRKQENRILESVLKKLNDISNQKPGSQQ